MVESKTTPEPVNVIEYLEEVKRCFIEIFKKQYQEMLDEYNNARK